MSISRPECADLTGDNDDDEEEEHSPLKRRKLFSSFQPSVSSLRFGISLVKEETITQSELQRALSQVREEIKKCEARRMKNEMLSDRSTTMRGWSK